MEDVVIVFFFVAIFFHFTNVKVKVKLIGERLEASNHGSLSIVNKFFPSFILLYIGESS